MLKIEGLNGMREHEGRELGTGDWLLVTQEIVDRFAEVTGDDQWIHVNVERARTGPFGTTIAHGFLTLSLLPELTSTVYQVDGFGMAINYGLNRVRFPAPVPVGSQIRAAVRLDRVEEVGSGVQAEYEVTVTVEGAEKPSCVAVYVGRYYP